VLFVGCEVALRSLVPLAVPTTDFLGLADKADGFELAAGSVIRDW
jgi:hypothetical protein